MIVKLKEIPVIYICPDHNEKYLDKLEFKNIIHYKSLTNNAIIDIFSRYKPPFLLLENDVKETQDIPDNLELPDNTDAFYLGLSGDSEFEFINNNLYKVKNMLGSHAILYITPNYILNIRNQLITKPGYHNDVIISQLQDKFNIYCHKESYFYQVKEPNTKIVLNTKNSIIFVTAFININDSPIDDLMNNYFYYFEQLANTGIQIALFFDSNYKEYGNTLITKYNNVKIIRYLTKDELHINKLNISKQLPDSRNIKKDNENYLKLMNNKIYFIEEAMNTIDYDYYSWIDFRIFHIFKNLLDIDNKLKKISNKYYFSQLTYFPGAWSMKKNILNEINWRFLGGFFILSKSKINTLVNETTKLLENISTLTWEVNVWAILEYNNLFDFGWYKGDHNENILF